MKRFILLIFIFLAAIVSPALSSQEELTIKGIRFFSYPAFTRIVFEVEAAAPYVFTRSADGRSVQFSAYGGFMTLKTPLPQIRDAVVSGIELREEASTISLQISLEPAAGEIKDFVLRAPDRVVLDIAKANTPPAPGTAAVEKPAVIVIDPGHGGRDAGIGTGELEKAVSLELGQSIRKYLQHESSIKVVLTREKDLMLGLDERAAIANAAGARVFVSVHVGPGAAIGVYILDIEEEPQRDSASRDFLSYQTGLEQRDKIWGRQQAVHAGESGVLGRVLARELSGTQHAEPLAGAMAGLKAVDAAAVLVEVGLDADRTKTAEAIARGIEVYVRAGR